jgi:outer membrane protein assembly factor BamB
MQKGFTFILIALFIACKTKKTELVWNQIFPVIGSQSSPKATDLNSDGVLDIVMGAGKNEYMQSEFGVIALDGKTGSLLWKHPSNDQIYGSATLLDINNDKTDDVIIGGRSNNLMALDGKTGKEIWKFKYQFETDSILKHTKFNFQNSQIIPDQNGDGQPDLLVQNGGNPKALANSKIGREPGVLMIMDSKTGNILAADKMPDNAEAYMPPLYIKQPDGVEYIVFGTGGETLDGQLFIAKLLDLKNKNLKNAKVFASDVGHGFIAPTVAVDINNDQYLDLISISHGSKITATDGKSLKKIWELKIPNTESSNAFSVGNFNDDDVPDFFTFVSKGVWPESTGSVQIMINGKTGKIEYQNELGCTGFSSAVIYDLNHDGIDEAILSINEMDCGKGFVKNPQDSANKSDKVTNKLIAIDFQSKNVQVIDETVRFKNIFSTPWIGDIDSDKYLDIVHCQYFSEGSDLMLFLGMQVKRISTSIKIDKPIKWGEYMGEKGKLIYKKK